MDLVIKEKEGYKYIDEGKGEVLLLLHGLFGALSNWEKVIKHFGQNYRIIVPMLPIYIAPREEANLEGLTEFVEGFVDTMELKEVTLLGNSLGGHLALLYTIKHQNMVKRLVLTGSSGLFENTMGGSYPKRGTYPYVKQKVEYTFYDPTTATQELVDEVFEVTQSIPKCLNIVMIARSAQKHNMADVIPSITIPTLLVWGMNDTITPPLVAYEFERLIPNSTLRFIDECCHAPMMEHPEKFNHILEKFLLNNSI